jgi:hypothetical protein
MFNGVLLRMLCISNNGITKIKNLLDIMMQLCSDFSTEWDILDNFYPNGNYNNWIKDNNEVPTA